MFIHAFIHVNIHAHAEYPHHMGRGIISSRTHSNHSNFDQIITPPAGHTNGEKASHQVPTSTSRDVDRPGCHSDSDSAENYGDDNDDHSHGPLMLLCGKPNH